MDFLRSIIVYTIEIRLSNSSIYYIMIKKISPPIIKKKKSSPPKNKTKKSCSVKVADCKFSPWGEFGDCSCPCNGIKERTRRIATYPEGGGEGCLGGLKEIKACNVPSDKNCPEYLPKDCKISDWGKWGECDAKCGGGHRKRVRSIVQKPVNGGNACEGTLEEVEPFTH